MPMYNYMINSAKCRGNFWIKLWAFRVRTDSFWLQNQKRLLASLSVWSQIQSLPFCFALHHKEQMPANFASLLLCQMAPAQLSVGGHKERLEDWRAGGARLPAPDPNFLACAMEKPIVYI